MGVRRSMITVLAAAALVASSCGDDNDLPDTSGPATEAPDTTPAPDTTTVPDTTTGPDTTPVPDTTTAPDPTTLAPSDAPDPTASPGTSDGTGTTAPLDGIEQPAIWPAADVVFATPAEAAEDFVGTALGVTPALGEFRQGDNRSGEIEVFSLGEGETSTPSLRSLLLLRRLGPSDGWFVLAAVNENASIESPESLAEVPAGELTVEGVGRGFEGTVTVTAFAAGAAGAELDEVITQGGALETPEPFEVRLDLSGAEPGDVVVLLVRGDTGLETDPGDFGAIPVVIAG